MDKDELKQKVARAIFSASSPFSMLTVSEALALAEAALAIIEQETAKEIALASLKQNE